MRSVTIRFWLGSAPPNYTGGTRGPRYALCLSICRMSAVPQGRKSSIYRARIVHSDAAGIIVKAPHKIAVGARIAFAMLSVLEGVDASNSAPASVWRSAVIWRIEKDCLRLTRT